MTPNDRKTGIVKIIKIESKNSKYIAKLIVSVLNKEKGRIHTKTPDNGREFAVHEYVSEKLGIDFYFADP